MKKLRNRRKLTQTLLSLLLACVMILSMYQVSFASSTEDTAGSESVETADWDAADPDGTADDAEAEGDGQSGETEDTGDIDDYGIATVSAEAEEEENEFLEFDDAVAYARQQMKYDSRSSQFYLYYTYHGEEMSNSIANSESSRILNEVYAHTGKGSEGDYIYQHLFSCQRYLVGYEQVDDDTWHITYRIVPSSLSNGDKEKEIDAFEQELFDEILLPCMSDYEKVGAIYDWLVKNASYASHREWSVYSAWGAIIDGEAVCHGYTLALYKLLNDAGIDCRYEANAWHAWNIVNLGDCYYYCDSTWDNGKRSQFLKCWDSFADYYHEASSPWNTEEWAAQYPMAAANYDPDTATDGSNVPHHVYETTASDGVTTHTCIYCGETYTGDHSEDHHILYYAAADPTCETEGNIEYWHCLDCDVYYTDESLSDASIVSSDTVKIAATGHQNVSHTAAVAATREKDGNVEYWYCEDCGEYFLDEALTERAMGPEVVLPANENLVDVKMTINWEDADGNPADDEQIPDTADVELMGEEEGELPYTVATATLGKADNWEYTFENLSNEISYTVNEMIDGDIALVEYDPVNYTLDVTAVINDEGFEVAGDIKDVSKGDDEDISAGSDSIEGGIGDADSDADDTDAAGTAPTGDTANTWVWLIIVIAAAVVIIIVAVVMRRKKSNK